MRNAENPPAHPHPMRWILLLLVGVSFAGCAGPSVASAGTLREAAEARAQSWDPSAVLVQVLAVESASGKAVLDGAAADLDAIQKALVAGRDGNVGDGRATAWLFRFRGASESLAIVLDANGGVRYQGSAATTASLKPLGPWRVDSHEALALASSNRTFADGPRDMVTVQLIETRGGYTAWQITNEGEAWYVDAETRELIPGKRAELTPSPLQRDAGISGGTVTAADPLFREAFSLQQNGHDALVVAARFARPLANTLELRVTAPGGNVTATPVQASNPADEFARARLIMDDVPQGLYQVEIELTGGAYQAITLYWCSDGMPIIQDESNEACAVLDG